MSPQGNRWYWFVVFLVRQICLRLLTGGMKVVGLENVPREGPVILAPIHVSNFDPPVVSCASPRAVNFMAKEELFSPKWMGKLITSLGAFPVKRGAGDTSAVKIAIERLQEGCTLILFPEGTRGDAKTLGQIQSGVAMIAKRSGAKVIPVGIYGTHKIMPKGRNIPGFSRLCVAFGKPFTFEEITESEKGSAARDAFGKKLEDGLIEQCAVAGLDVKTSTGN